MDPKKNCTPDDCPDGPATKEKKLKFRLSNKDGCDDDECPLSSSKYHEEKEIKTIDLCNDPGCSNVQQKKIVDLNQGLSQLENILKNMTGLCREPKCPSKSPTIENAIDAARQNLPLPSRYYPEDTKSKSETEENKASKEARPSSGDKTLRDILNYKTCKGAVCYSAYMGYKIEPMVKEDPVCGSNSCLPKQKQPKQVCGSPTCPFGQKPKDAGYSSTYNSNYMDTTPKSTTMGPCGGFTCPSPKTDLFSSTFTSKLPTNNLFNDLQPSYLPSTNGGLTSKPCDFNTCPLNKQDTTSQVPVGLCGRTSCPFASLEYAQKLSQLGSKSNFGTGDITKTSTSPCGNSVCPFSDPQTKLCGDPNCPFAQKNQGPPKVGLCGRNDCPFASVTPNVKPHTTAPCGNPDCNFGETTYEPVGLCGEPCCPMMGKTSPGAVQPCPFADRIKRYPCGSPSCPYVNPSGMLYTHEYSYDRSFVQEAARPYCGSASPFDYMSSLTPTYPSPLATNYPLFSYTEPPKIPICPYMPKKPRKSCGKPTCPYAQENQPEKDNFCIDRTCPFGEGICGGQRKFSCESPNVEHCQSPDCKVPGPKKKKKDKDKCCCCGGDNNDEEDDDMGQCGGPKKYSCESPNVEHCRSPDCAVHREKKKKKKRSTCCRMPEVEEEGVCGGPKKFSCDSPEVIHCESPECAVPKPDGDDFCGSPVCHSSQKRGSKRKRPSNASKSNVSGDIADDETASDYTEEKKGEAGECSSKTCPYLKKLVFCDDCGGVLPDEDTPESTTTESVGGSVEGTAGTVPSESEGKKLNSEEIEERRISKQKEDPLKKGLIVESEEVVPVRTTVSLYDYPGVQIGHRECSYKRKLIPRNMGWLWNHIPSFGNPEFWRGYKPGAILKSVYKIMKKHRKDFDSNDIKNKKRSRSRMRMLDLKHCIEVKKKEGEYLITVNPVKDPHNRDPLDSPYMDVTPIQFKVEKDKSDKPEAFCPCDELDEKSEVSTEFDFHFTPPAAIPDPYPKKKKNTTEANVQYNVMDLPPELRANIKGASGGGGGKNKGGKGKKGKKGKKK